MTGTTFVLNESMGPVTDVYGKKVTYVTENGKVPTENDLKTRVRVGVPVSVQYVRDSSNRVISRVVVDDRSIEVLCSRFVSRSRSSTAASPREVLIICFVDGAPLRRR